MSLPNNILLVLNGHKYVSYFFEPIAQIAHMQGIKVNLAIPDAGEFEEKNWPLATSVRKFKVMLCVTNPCAVLREIFQKAFIPIDTQLLHVVTTHMIFLCLLRLTIRREHFEGIFVMHFIGLGRALGGTGYLCWFIRTTLKGLWLVRPRRGIIYRCIFLNDDDHRVLYSIFGDREVKYCKIPGAGVRKDRFDYHSIDLSHDFAQPYKLLFVGRLIEEKGIEKFVRLISEINTRSAVRVIGEIVGGFETEIYQSKIQTLVRKLRLSDVLNFVGSVENPAPHFKNSHFLIFPSYYGEGVPTVLLESQYCGTPCLASDIAGCREAIIDGVTSHIVATDRVDDWLSAFLQMIDATNYAKMSESAHHWVSQNFDAITLATSTIEWICREFETEYEGK